MFSIRKHFSKRSPRERRLILLAAAVVLFYILFVYVGEPLLDWYADLKEQKESKLETLTEYQAIMAKKDVYRKKILEANSMREEIRGGLLTGKNPEIATATLQGIVKDFARDLNIKFDRITINQTKIMNGYSEVGIKIPFTCYIAELRDFMYKIESAQQLLFITDLDIRVTNPRKPDTLRVSMDVSGFILNEEEQKTEETASKEGEIKPEEAANESKPGETSESAPKEAPPKQPAPAATETSEIKVPE